jgi:FdhE protein
MMTTNDSVHPVRRDDQEILARLGEAKENNPELTEVVDLQHDLLEAQMQVQVDLAAPQYSAEEAQARFGQGVPLLRPQEMALDWEAFSILYGQVCQITAEHRPDLSAQFGDLLTLLDDNPARVRALVATYLEEGNLMATGLGRETESEEEREQKELLTFVFNHALQPFLKAYADVLVPLIEQSVDTRWDKFWRRGRCPICGGEPDLAYLDDEAGSRHLVCSRCDSQWLYPRVKCPFCDTSEPHKLSYYPSEDDVYRVYVCQNCQRYLKVIDLRRAGRRVLFPVERVTTINLDVAVREEGYR